MTTISTWSDISRIIAIFGSALAVIGTIGHFALGKIIDRQKGERIAQLESGNASLRSELERTSETARTAKAGIEIMREFAEVADLNLIGKPYPDGDIIFTTQISKAMEGSYEVTGATVNFRTDENAERILRNTIREYPKFPFAYYGLAWILSQRHDDSWRFLLESV